MKQKKREECNANANTHKYSKRFVMTGERESHNPRKQLGQKKL